MEFTQIPQLKQKISRVALGTWSIGGWMWGGQDDAESIATIHQALDLGINIIDTAPVYGFGLSEEIVGRALQLVGKRNEVVIATKAGISWKDGKVYRDTRKAVLEKELDDSLKRLQVDYIDLYQVHWPDSKTPVEETAQTMNSFLKAGKIRAIGVSNFSVDQMQQFAKIAPLNTLQSPFNLFEQAMEKDELAFCTKTKIATLGYGPLCRGLLSGAMQKERQFQGDDIRKVDPKFKEPRYSQYLQCTQRLQKWVEQKHKRSLLALAIRWVLDKEVNVALWGARKPNQLNGLDSVFGWNLTQQDFAEIDQIIQETVLDPIGPEFMMPPLRQT